MTMWVNLEVDCVVLWIGCRSWKSLDVECSAIQGFSATPKVPSLIVGMNDMVTSYLEREDEVSPPRRGSTPRRGRPQQRGFVIAGVTTEELLSDFFTGLLARITQRVVRDIPSASRGALEEFNRETLPRWRHESLLCWLLLSKTWSSPSARSIEATQQGICWAALRHTALPPAERVRLRPETRPHDRLFPPEAKAAVACLPCFAGLLWGGAKLGRRALRYIRQRLNEDNVESWEAAVLRSKEIREPQAE